VSGSAGKAGAYSLVSAPVLGFDLARLAGGAAAADVLLRALTLVGEDLPVLAALLPPDAVRVELWQEVDAAARERRGVRELTDTDPASIHLLHRAPVGTMDGLLACLRYEVLDWTWDRYDGKAVQHETAVRASALLCDAVVSCYLREVLAAPTRRRLAAGWVAAVRRLPLRPADLGPQHLVVSRLLQRLRVLPASDGVRLKYAADRARRGQAAWASAMHSASWAVYLSGRLRAAAAAQLLLVLALDAVGVPVADRASGVWNAMSGAVQALLVRDLLDGATAECLMEPYLAALGPSGLGESSAGTAGGR
jgi:hypothetical protein